MVEPQAMGEKKRYEGDEVALTAWHWLTTGWQVQVTAKSEAAKRSGNGYLLLSLDGANELWGELTQLRRDWGLTS